MKIAGRGLAERGPVRLFGILNLTPDSFFDGGRFINPEAALARALVLEAEGADALDVGGESTRPGSGSVSEKEEKERVLPVLKSLRGRISIPVSIDTSKAGVAEAALECGAAIINDVSALSADPRMASLAASSGVPVVLMHMRGTPGTMQKEPVYGDVVAEVLEYLLSRAAFAEKNGVAAEDIILDPGIGFGKTVEHNLALIRGFAPAVAGRFPVLIGHSRKNFIGRLLDNAPPEERLCGSLGAAAAASLSGAAFLRVHDVRATRELLKVLSAIRKEEPCPSSN